MSHKNVFACSSQFMRPIQLIDNTVPQHKCMQKALFLEKHVIQ